MKRICLMMALAFCTTMLAADSMITVTSGLSIEDYLGSQGLSWSTGGNAAWFGQTAVSRTGTAMQSGDISDGQESWIETTVQGPCDFNFWWNVSSEEEFDFLIFSVNGVEQDSLSGYHAANPAQDIGWTQKKLSFPAGRHTLRWTYKKDGSESLASDCGWLANVEYVPSVTVTFNAQGGVASTNEKVVKGFAPYGTLPTATKTGHQFSQWQTTEGEAVTESTVVTIITNHTLYASWTPESYTVTFHAQGGSVSPSAATVTYGTTYGTLPVPTRTGYFFDGWFTQPDGAGTEITAATIVAITAAQTLHAKWMPILYMVSFDAQGGSVNPSMISVIYGSPYETLPVPARTGHLFGGWFTQPDGAGSQITAATTVTRADDHTLYAKWTPESYTVTFHAQGGSVSPSAASVTYGTTYGTLPVPTRTGHLFDGWFTQPDGAGSRVTAATAVTITADQTLYAKWIAQIFIVSFNGQGSTPSPLSKEVTNSLPYGILATVSKTGYAFNGWFTAPSGAGVQITPSTVVSLTSAQTLYASWTPNTYNVLFNGQGGVVNLTNKVVSYQTPYGTLPVSVLADAVMDSWWTQPNGKGQKITAETNVLILADQTLYAKWDINSILGSSGLAWTTDGSGGAFWMPQATVKPAGRTLAMQTGAITHNQSTWIETTVTGPGTLSFSWAIAAEVNRDMITCTTNGVLFKTITSKSGNWTNETVTVGEGVCTIRWTFAKDAAGTVAADKAWLGAVSWTPQAGGFSVWASNHGLAGDAATLFSQDRNGDGIPNGLEYAFGANLPVGEKMLLIRSVNGRIMADIPKQDPATIPFVTVTLKATSDLVNWTLPTVPAADTTGMPANRAWHEASGAPAQAFFKLQALLK